MSKCRGIIVVFALALCALPTTADARSFGERTLAKGHKGSDVRVLQALLTQTGHTTKVDGRYGRGTVRSVRSWEAAAARAVNGRVSRKDARRLRTDAAEAGKGRSEDPVADAPITDTEEAAAEANPAASGGMGYVRVAKAKLNSDGTATAPAGAPQAVKDIIAAGNRIHAKPYRYGGGHGKWKDTGYDCSGSLSYALHGADLVKAPLNSTGFESWGSSGPGTWVTVYANAGHAYMVVAGLRYDTSGASPRGSRWTNEMRSSAGFVARHPAGL